MHIPVFAVTGFLDSGKTTLIEKMICRSELGRMNFLIIQFETGEQELNRELPNCHILEYGRKDLEQSRELLAEQISVYLRDHETDEIWIEWNGMTPFSWLLELISQGELRNICRIRKVLHTSDAETLDIMLGQTGTEMTEQIMNSDLEIFRNAEKPELAERAGKRIHEINPGVKILRAAEASAVDKVICSWKINPVTALAAGIMCFLGIYGVLSMFWDLTRSPMNTLMNVFLGIILQAIPFLILGVLISSAIQTFIRAEAIEKHFPKKTGTGILAALLLGFCLPVCDCTSVPIFRSLIKKGVPLPAAVTFLTATPVINPVVMLSTYYAFSGNIRIVAVRVGLGMLASALIGLSFSVLPAKEILLTGSFDRIMCSCGCTVAETDAGRRGKLGTLIRHSQTEFFNVGKYLMIGAFISALFQTLGARSWLPHGGIGFALSLFIMMGLAFLLSLCSSSDAVVARSFGSFFQTGAMMGFLVFGPMMDIKNLLMLSGGFKRKFVIRLVLVTFIICYLVVFFLVRPLAGV